MNARTIIATAALAFATAGSAFAQEATVFPTIDLQGHISRAEVRAEAIRAMKSGELTETAVLSYQFAPAESKLSRAEVRATTVRALRNGSIDKLDAEAYGFYG